jgi:hypothetical protein
LQQSRVSTRLFCWRSADHREFMIDPESRCPELPIATLVALQLQHDGWSAAPHRE